MKRLLLAAPAALVFSTVTASAQVNIYVTPGYAASTYGAPTFANPYTYAVPAPAYPAPAPSFVIPEAPVYNDAPGYVAPIYGAPTFANPYTYAGLFRRGGRDCNFEHDLISLSRQIPSLNLVPGRCAWPGWCTSPC
jgi:hypothetical protein